MPEISHPIDTEQLIITQFTTDKVRRLFSKLAEFGTRLDVRMALVRDTLALVTIEKVVDFTLVIGNDFEGFPRAFDIRYPLPFDEILSGSIGMFVGRFTLILELKRSTEERCTLTLSNDTFHLDKVLMFFSFHFTLDIQVFDFFFGSGGMITESEGVCELVSVIIELTETLDAFDAFICLPGIVDMSAIFPFDEILSDLFFLFLFRAFDS